MERPFRTPLVPLVPILGMCSAFYLMIKLPLLTWEVLIIWLVIGLVIYFTYSIKHSKVQAMSPAQIGILSNADLSALDLSVLTTTQMTGLEVSSIPANAA